MPVSLPNMARVEGNGQRVSRFPRFDEPGGELLQPGDDDESYVQIVWSGPADQTPNA